MTKEFYICPTHKTHIIGKACDSCREEKMFAEEHDWEEEE